MMVPPILAHWGWTQDNMDEMVQAVRTMRGSDAVGPPTDDEEGLIVMSAAANRLRRAGYEVVLRREGP